MKIVLSPHALKRMAEREIDKQMIVVAVRTPDKIEVSKRNQNRFLIKKVYHNSKFKSDHLLLIVCEENNDFLKVVTIIDTSKISKYF